MPELKIPLAGFHYSWPPKELASCTTPADYLLCTIFSKMTEEKVDLCKAYENTQQIIKQITLPIDVKATTKFFKEFSEAYSYGELGNLTKSLAILFPHLNQKGKSTFIGQLVIIAFFLKYGDPHSQEYLRRKLKFSSTIKELQSRSQDVLFARVIKKFSLEEVAAISYHL